MLRFLILAACVCTFSLRAEENVSSMAQLEAHFEELGLDDPVESARELLDRGSEEQEEIYKLCRKEAKRVWGIGEEISREAYKKDLSLKAKVFATTIAMTLLYEKGFPLEVAADLAKIGVERKSQKIAG